MKAGGRLRRPGQLGEPAAHGLDRRGVGRPPGCRRHAPVRPAAGRDPGRRARPNRLARSATGAPARSARCLVGRARRQGAVRGRARAMDRGELAAELLGAIAAERARPDPLERERRRLIVHAQDPRDRRPRLPKPAQPGGLRLEVGRARARPRLHEGFGRGRAHAVWPVRMSSSSARQQRSTISTTSANPSSPP